MLRLLIGQDWTAVQKEILSRIASDVARQQGGRILMVPELISHETERMLCRTAGDTASRFAEVLSFTGLSRRVCDCVGSGAMKCLDGGGRIVAMASAARSLHSRLKAYASVETKPEFLEQLVDAVDEFKRCCISPGDLQAAAEQTEGSFAQKLEELSLIYSAYDGLCARGKRDPRDQMTWLLEQLEDGDFGENHVFYIDGFPDFTRQHMAILEYLIRVSPEVTVGINCDEIDTKTLAFEKAGETAAQFYRSAVHAGVEVRVEKIPGRNDQILEICGHIFQGNIQQGFAGAVLSVFQAGSAAEETAAAANRVMELVRSGCRYREIGVVCAGLNSYRNLAELLFHRCRIPIYLSGKEDILQKTVVSTVLSALDAALGGFEQRDVLRYLKSVLSPLDPDTCDRLENYAVIWAIRGNRWKETWTGHPGGLGELWTEEAKQELEALNAARKAALSPLFSLREGFREGVTLAGQVDAVCRFLEEIGLDQRLSDLAEELDQAGDNRSAQILNQLWEILLGALEQMYDVLGETVWEPENFVRLLVLLLSQYDVGTIPPVLDAVHIGDVSTMRCRKVRHLIVLGASEGALPGYGGSEGILSDQERVALRQMGVPLTGGAMEGIQAEFAEIYGVFCGAAESICVSCPSGQPSYLYRRLAAMAGSEQQADPGLGAACAGEQMAGAYLAARKAEQAAQALGLDEWYQETCRRAEFTLGAISKEQIRALYGRSLTLSASQIDRQAECRMSYFLKYGMRAKERKEADVNPAEFGTYVHAVLEHTAAEVMNRGGFHQVSLEDTMEIALGFSESYCADRFSQIDSKRIAYLFQRNRRELEMVVAELWNELKASLFEPKEFELGFGAGKKMDAIAIPSSSMPAVVRGFVDRVDLWKRENGTYFRVVDYKTGKKDFDYCDVFNGVGLQMLLYLFALERTGGEVIGPHCTAAGVQYFPARVPLLNLDGSPEPEEIEKLRQKEWKRKGLVLKEEDVLTAMDPEDPFVRLSVARKKDGTISGDAADRQQLKILEQYVFSWLGGMVDEIASGNITPNPYTRGTSHNACSFCPYGAVCCKDSVEGRRNYKAMSAQSFWEEVEKEVGHRG